MSMCAYSYQYTIYNLVPSYKKHLFIFTYKI